MSSAKKWDQYFYNVCVQVSKNSKCMSRQIGAILVKDKSILTTGYNGPPRGVPHCNVRHKYDSFLLEAYKRKGLDIDEFQEVNQCPRKLLGYKSGEGLEYCVAAHAERNVLINAARHGVCTNGGTLYMSCNLSCTPCLIEIINAGIKEIVVMSLQPYDETSKFLLRTSNLIVRRFVHLKIS